MRVVFRQAGGVAGLFRGVELDAAELPAELRGTLERFLESGEGAREAAAGPARDQLTYRLRVERPGGDVSLDFDEVHLPHELEPLVDFLQSRSRPRAPE